jgi:autotransporter adhesin
VADTDVTTVGQVNNLFSSFSGSSSAAINQVNNRVSRVENDLQKGIAVSSAMQPFLPDPGKSFRLNVGAATYSGEQGMGITGAGRINDDWAAYIGAGSTSNGDESIANVGVSYQW